ncbi:MAG: response regulator, partial [Calditrichia bacterium]
VLAKNGKEAIEVAGRELPNLIILDALMPVMNGFEACRRLKSSILTQHIPVIFLSANYTEEKHRIEGLELGADDYILKPG